MDVGHQEHAFPVQMLTRLPQRYHDRQPWKGSETKTTFRFYCAQNQQEVKRRKVEPVRAKTLMERYRCMGYMRITIDTEDFSLFSIRYKHPAEHEHYTDISIPAASKECIKSKKDKTPSELFFTQKQVYACGSLENELAWKLHPDQLVSTGMILDRIVDKGIERVPLLAEAGVGAFAFVVKDVLSERGAVIHELAMDSTCKHHCPLLSLVRHSNYPDIR